MMRASSNKPLIRCPHCRERIEADHLLRHRKYRNKFGLDVFECPQCQQRLKFEPTEYLLAREALAKGTAPSATIAAVKPDERLPSEEVTSGQSVRPRWQTPLVALGTIAAVVVGYLMLR
jgi:hypothetical protein